MSPAHPCEDDRLAHHLLCSCRHVAYDKDPPRERWTPQHLELQSSRKVSHVALHQHAPAGTWTQHASSTTWTQWVLAACFMESSETPPSLFCVIGCKLFLSATLSIVPLTANENTHQSEFGWGIPAASLDALINSNLKQQLLFVREPHRAL